MTDQSPFRILYLMTEPFGIGGVQSDIKALGPHFVKQGHEVILACPEGDQVDYLTSRGVRHIPFSVHFRGPLSFYDQAKKLRLLITEVAPTVLAPQSIRASWICHAAAKGIPIPRVTTIHNIHSPINALWAGIILNKASHLVIFESDHEHQRIVRLGLAQRKTAVIPSGIDTDLFFRSGEPPEALRREIPEIGPDSVIFGCVARLSEEKAHNNLIAAFSGVLRSHPQARLVLVGDGPLRETLEKQVASLGINHAVHFAGQRSNIREYLNLFDVFVLASTRESLPRAARESMACGLPVIATRVGATREAVQEGHNGYLVTPGNVSELEERMTELLTDSALRKSMGERSLEMIERRFSQRRWLSENEKVYRKAGALAGNVALSEIESRLLGSGVTG